MVEHVEDPGSRLQRLIAQLAPQVRDRFLASVRTMLGVHTLAELANLISNGRLEQALDEVVGAAGTLGGAWTRAYVAAGEGTSSFLGRALAEISLHFDGTNYRAVQAMRGNSLRLVREFTAEQRAATRQAIEAGVARGANPIEQARAFRESIGLTRFQERAVANYRRALESGSQDALGRELRDRRFDRTVQGAVDGDRVLTGKQVDTMVDRYRERYVRYRSEVIGRTEAMSAANEGAMESYRQAIENGVVDADQVERTWNTAEDSRVRDSHDAMDGQTVGADEPFTSGAGNLLLYPGDPSAPPEDRIQCFIPQTCVIVPGLQKVLRRNYSGIVIRLVAAGVDLTVTPNHPILTTRGWIAAGDVVENDELIQRLCFEDSIPSNPEIADQETTASQIFDSVSESSFAVTQFRNGASRTTVDFHGETFDGDVDIIRTNCKLWHGCKSDRSEMFDDIILESSDLAKGALLAKSLLGKNGRRPCTSSNSIIGSSNQLLSLDGRETRHSQAVCITPTAFSDSQIPEAGIDETTSSSDLICDLQDGQSVEEQRVHPTQIRCSAFRVISKIRTSRHWYSGPVYNFETASGLILASSIVTHNCRCTVSVRITAPTDAGADEA